MDCRATTDATKTKDELESKKAQEVIGLLLSNAKDNKEVLQDVSYTAVERIIQDAAAQSSAVTVSLAGSTNFNVCHVSLTEAGMLLEAGDIIQHSLDGETPSIQLQDGCTLIQNYEAVDESDSSDAAAKFIDGQAVQLEDGTTAFIHAAPGEGLQPVQLEDGTMAYLSQSGGELFNGEASSLDLENLAGAQVFAEGSDGEGKEYDEKPKKPSTLSVGHTSKYLDKAFTCPYANCHRLYTTYHHLKVHERSHTGDRPFKCQFPACNKAFATGYGLKSHTRIHTGETPYKCPEEHCHKAFKTSGDLQKHVRTHTGERPFKCPYSGCDRAFTTSNIRKVHIRTHTGERPYVCKEEGCGRAFASATNYKNHIRIHTGEKPYVCVVPGCNKRFTEYSSLYKHHVVHTHSKPYTCSRCGKTYRQTSTLALHKRTVHGIIDPSPDEDIADPDESKERLEISSASANLPAKGNVEIKVPTTAVKTEDLSPENTSVNTTSTTVDTTQGENLSHLLSQNSVYAVQVQEGNTLFTGSMQQIVFVTDPQQLAALQELASQGQLETVLSVKEHTPKES